MRWLFHTLFLHTMKHETLPYMLRIKIHDLLLRGEKRRGKKKEERNCKYDPDTGARMHEKKNVIDIFNAEKIYKMYKRM